MKFKSEIVTQASGSIGGTTYAHNRGGMYRRARTIPTNPGTSRQTAVRNAMAAANNSWISVLTSAQRATWDTYAANVERTNTLGDPIFLTGQQTYVGFFVARTQAGLTVPTTGSSIFDRGEPVTSFTDPNDSTPNQIGLTAGDVEITATFATVASAAGDTLFFIGPPVNPTINFWKGPYQLATVVSFAAAAAGVNLVAAASALTIGSEPADGQFRPIRIVNLYDDGRQSIEYRAIAPVVASV